MGSFRPMWGNPGEDEQTCEHRFGSREECERYAAKRMLQSHATLCGAVESPDPVNAKLTDTGEVEMLRFA